MLRITPIILGITIHTIIEHKYCCFEIPVAPAIKIDEECSSENHFKYCPMSGNCVTSTVIGGITKYIPITIVVS